MKTIGIIGGLGPEATIDYYKGIIRQINKKSGDNNLNYPEIVIYSVNMSKFIELLEQGDLKGAADYISYAINMLEAGGADFAAISANTPHLLFNEIKKNVNIPLISIVETCKIKAKEMGLKRCGLFGTKFTMNAPFYSEVFSVEKMDIMVPRKDEIELINNLLFSELELGIFKEGTKRQLLDIVNSLIKEKHIDSLILGCTEFPLMFTEPEYLGIPFLNTSQIHIEEIVARCLS